LSFPQFKFNAARVERAKAWLDAPANVPFSGVKPTLKRGAAMSAYEGGLN
jgi:hypothetical protein